MEKYERKQKLTTAFVMLLGVGAVAGAARYAYDELAPAWTTFQTDINYFSGELLGNVDARHHASGEIGTFIQSCFTTPETVGVAQVYPNRANPTEFTVLLRSNEAVDIMLVQDCAKQHLPEYTLTIEVEGFVDGSVQTVSQP